MMNHEEAIEWLRGKRSMCNSIPQTTDGQWHVMVAQADAAMTQQAHWIVKAHRDRLVIADIPKLKPRHFGDSEPEYCDPQEAT